jgi:hypothetical protein
LDIGDNLSVIAKLQHTFQLVRRKSAKLSVAGQYGLAVIVRPLSEAPSNHENEDADDDDQNQDEWKKEQFHNRFDLLLWNSFCRTNIRPRNCGKIWVQCQIGATGWEKGIRRFY